MSADGTPEAGSNGREASGRFGPSNRFGRGNPQMRRAYELRQAIQDATTPEMLRALTLKLAQMALKDGDMQAARLWLEYALGRAPQAIELSGPDGEPIGVDWARTEAAILAALKPFGDSAQFAVALAIRGVVDAAGAEQPGD